MKMLRHPWKIENPNNVKEKSKIQQKTKIAGKSEMQTKIRKSKEKEKSKVNRRCKGNTGKIKNKEKSYLTFHKDHKALDPTLPSARSLDDLRRVSKSVFMCLSV